MTPAIGEALHSPAPRTGNWVRFSCSISPLFVLSHSMPMINTTGKLASFCRFSLTTGSLPSDSLALTTGRCSFAPRRHPPHQQGQVVRRPFPAGYCLTDRRIGKDRTGPDLHERPLYIKYVTEPGDSCGKINPFLLTRCRPTVKHSLAAGDAQSQRLKACLPEAISRNASSLPDFPEFAQAVRYGVPGTPTARLSSTPSAAVARP